ncbi:hypothetical protein HHI36_019289 [Cryptolaemus montrouzieri]|uniref:Single domain-containing protein n=1 Tax=Cryptolaemus montrouzieri TaxID=559131 RepID=A0ABD2P3I5_9CUCU
MIKVKLMVVGLVLSLVDNSHSQSDNTCSYQGQQVTGDFTIPGYCVLYRCIPGQGVSTIGCGIRVPPPGCSIVYPETTNYPECCHTNIKCSTDNQPFVSSQNQIRADEDNGTSGYQQTSQSFPQLDTAFSPPPSTNDRPSFSSDSTHPSSSLQPPTGRGVTPSFRPQNTPKRRPFGEPFGRPEDVNKLPDIGNVKSGPYYYKK